VNAAAVVKCPGRIVGYFPHVSVGIGEGACRAAPVGAVRMTNDRASRVLRLREHISHLLRGTDVVRELDPRSPVSAERGPQQRLGDRLAGTWRTVRADRYWVDA
jgi:hypothetical protein